MDLVGLTAGAVEEDGEEANRNVEDFAGDLVSVDLCSVSSTGRTQGGVPTYKRPPLLVDGNEAQGTGTPAQLAPVILVGRRGRQMAVDGAIGQGQVGLLRLGVAVHLSLGRESAHATPPALKHRAPTPSPRPPLRVRSGILFNGRGRREPLLTRSRARYRAKVAIVAAGLRRRGRRRDDSRGIGYLVLLRGSHGELPAQREGRERRAADEPGKRTANLGVEIPKAGEDGAVVGGVRMRGRAGSRLREVVDG